MANDKVQFYGTGRRKSSVARVRLVPGNGQIVVNGKDSKDYFCKKTLEMIVRQPLVLTETEGRFDVLVCTRWWYHRSGWCSSSGYCKSITES